MHQQKCWCTQQHSQTEESDNDLELTKENTPWTLTSCTSKKPKQTKLPLYTTTQHHHAPPPPNITLCYLHFYISLYPFAQSYIYSIQLQKQFPSKKKKTNTVVASNIIISEMHRLLFLFPLSVIDEVKSQQYTTHQIVLSCTKIILNSYTINHVG